MDKNQKQNKQEVHNHYEMTTHKHSYHLFELYYIIATIMSIPFFLNEDTISNYKKEKGEDYSVTKYAVVTSLSCASSGWLVLPFEVGTYLYEKKTGKEWVIENKENNE